MRPSSLAFLKMLLADVACLSCLLGMCSLFVTVSSPALDLTSLTFSVQYAPAFVLAMERVCVMQSWTVWS